jgi:DNA-binding response OmpR family regulator
MPAIDVHAHAIRRMPADGRIPAAPAGVALAPPRRIGLACDDATAAAPWRAGLVAEGLQVHDWPPHRETPPAQPEVLVLHLAHGVASQLGALRTLALHEGAGRPIAVVCRGLRDLDHVLALEIGADDVFDAALDSTVAAARLRALWRRCAAIGMPAAPDALHVGRLELRRRERCVLDGGAPVDLTEGEFELLWRLALRAGEVVTRGELLRELRGLSDAGPDRSIDSRVYRIRAKLAAGGRAHAIRTVRNRGYLLAPALPDSSAPAGNAG